jgi:hypothetical protein
MTDASVAILVISYPISNASKTALKETSSMILFLSVNLVLTIAIPATKIEVVFLVTLQQITVCYQYLHQDAYQ